MNKQKLTTERPILFNSEMVRAVLDERKTQTRRVIKPQTQDDLRAKVWDSDGTTTHWYSDATKFIQCPYGKKGDRLWVRESMRKADMLRDDNMYYSADDKGVGNDIWFKFVDYGWADKKSIPSIHMPRWASRINLEIIDIRVERVCDISQHDSEAEGVHKEWDGSYPWYKNYSGIGHANFKCDAKRSFQTLWDSINKKRGFGWDVNPFVWVVKFKLLKQC